MNFKIIDMKKDLLIRILFVWFLAVLILVNTDNLYAQGSGYALEFDGIDDYVAVPTDSADELNPQDEITIESWIFLNEAASATHRPHYLGKIGSYQLIIETNGLPKFYTRDGVTWLSTTGTTTIETGKWYHIAGTFDGSNMRIYVNGKMEGVPTARIQPLEQNNNELRFGDYFGDEAALAGSLDEIRIWGVARSETELQNAMNIKLAGNESNLLGYWNLNDGSGLGAIDLTTNGNNGTLINMDSSSDWITSTAPIGDASIFAESAEIAETSSCEIDVVFGIGLDAPGTGFSLAAMQVNELPNTTTGLDNNIADRYWEIWSEDNNFDDNFTSSVYFHYDNVSGIIEEADLVLYRRDNADATSWSSVSGFSIITDDGASSNPNDGVGYIQLDITEATLGGFSGQYMLSWNHSPVANNDSDSTTEETPVIIDVLANDTDSDGSLDPSTVSISVDPLHGTITNVDAATGAITYSPELNYFGSDQFSYTVDDDGGATSNSAVVDLKINPVNDLPIVANIPGQSIAEGEIFVTISLDDYVSDDEDSVADITWSWSGNTDLSVTLDSIRVATIGIPDENWYGSETLTFIATDLDGGQDSDTAAFTVISVNDPPVVSSIADQTIDEGELFAPISLDNFVTDVEDTVADITWSWTGNTDLSVTLDSSRVATIGIPDENWYGDEIIVFTATDQEGDSDSDSVAFTVNPVNDLPVVTDIPDQTIAEGELFSTISLDNFVTDVEDTITDITWSWTGNTDLSVTLDSNRVVTIGIPDENWYGSEIIIFSATDLEGGIGSDTATYTVTPINDPPVVTDIPDQTIDEGDIFATINLDDFVSDTEDPDTDIIWDWSGNTDLSVTIDGNRIATIGFPDENWNGVETIVFTAIDLLGSEDSDSATFAVNPINDAPVVVTNIPDTTGASLEEFVYQLDSLTFNDVDAGDTLTYSAALTTGDLPDWLSFDADTQTFSGTPETEDVGSYTVLVTAYDLDMESVTDTFEIQIIRGVLGLVDIAEDRYLNIYPNPVRDIVYIETSNIADFERLEFHLFNIVGTRMSVNNRITFNRNIVEIDLTHIPTGIYVMLIQNEGNTIKYKLNKQ
jgi:hypothetical protein